MFRPDTIVVSLAGQKLRMGFILTDYTNRFAINNAGTGPVGDPWPNWTIDNRNFPGTGFLNFGDIWGKMQSFRNTLIWSGESVIFVNKEYPLGNSSCTWDALNKKLGL